jgi:hypothetical protein
MEVEAITLEEAVEEAVEEVVEEAVEEVVKTTIKGTEVITADKTKTKDSISIWKCSI